MSATDAHRIYSTLWKLRVIRHYTKGLVVTDACAASDQDSEHMAGMQYAKCTTPSSAHKRRRVAV